MQIFITGASGFVGGGAMRHLIGSGHAVSAMSRSEKSDIAIRAAGATPVRCDLETVAADHIRGADIIIHAAAFVEQWGPKDAWFKSNVLGTQAVLDAAGHRRAPAHPCPAVKPAALMPAPRSS